MTPKTLCRTVDEAMDFVTEKLRAVTDRRPILYLPGNAGRVPSVEDWIFDNAKDLNKAYAFQTLGLGPAAGWQKAVAGGITPVTPFIGPAVRGLVNNGLAVNIRSHLSLIHNLFNDVWRPDVAIAHVSPPDEFSRVTLGLNAGLDWAPVQAARCRIAVINRRMPRWHIGNHYDPETNRHYESGCAMSLADFDAVVEVDEPLVEHVMRPKANEVVTAKTVAAHVVELLQKDSEDPAVLPHMLQLGIGVIPNAIAEHLAAENIAIRGMWSEMFSDGVLDLYKKGLIQKIGGGNLRENIVVGFVLGTNALYQTMAENPSFAVLPQEIVNDPAMVQHNDYMVSVNTTLSISVTGEVAAASKHKHYHSDVGGQHDFALGASWSKGGRPIIALLSTAKPPKADGLVSKIVAAHEDGTHATISADLPVIVATEFGVADLRFVDDRQRVRKMLAVAHPDMRERLSKEARRLPAIQGVDALPPRLVTLSDGTLAMVRPATSDDMTLIREYVMRLSISDMRNRFMGNVTHEAMTSPERLIKLYDETLDFKNDHAAFVVEQDGEIMGVANAFAVGKFGAEKEGSYEVAFSRRSDRSGLWIGERLMRILLEWGQEVGAKRFFGVTYTNNRAMRSLFEMYRFTGRKMPEDITMVHYEAEIADITSSAPVNQRWHNGPDAEMELEALAS
ncbi:MAG: GNAT family N-acetyltransferase [Magnetospiraceae bacterium]